jgi:hypothetical protein
MNAIPLDNRRIERTIVREMEKGKSFAAALVIAVAQMEMRRVRLESMK